jgi:hypothetical protein
MYCTPFAGPYIFLDGELTSTGLFLTNSRPTLVKKRSNGKVSLDQFKKTTSTNTDGERFALIRTCPIYRRARFRENFLIPQQLKVVPFNVPCLDPPLVRRTAAFFFGEYSYA